jgi:hypothetical protein
MLVITTVVTFLLALLGAFFDGVEKDSNGIRKRSKLGLPVLTPVGRILAILLLISSAVALWKESEASKD